MKITRTRQIFLGLFLGAVAGALLNRTHPEWARIFRPFSVLFLRLVKMLIAPLIFSSLVAGIGGAGRLKAVGRMGARALVYFEIVSTIALAVGLVVVNLLQPGLGINLPPPGTPGPALAQPQGWEQALVHLVPDSVVDAMARGDVLQIVVFSVLFAVAVNLAGEKGAPILRLCASVSEAMFKLTNIIMGFAPVGVGCAIAYTVGHGGLSTLFHLGTLVLCLYLALAVFLFGVLLPIALFLRIPLRRFVEMVKEPAAIAFTTTSSEAALPRAMEALERFGVPRHIVAFLLPLGYSFNLDGSALYLSLAAVFVAQAANVQLGAGRQLALLLTLMITSKGIAAVPRASLVILAGALASFGLPLEGATLILGVDELMDMGRTMVNVVGNCLATVAVAKWEGAFAVPGDPQPAAPATAFSDT